jgi:hypothetical protein
MITTCQTHNLETRQYSELCKTAAASKQNPVPAVHLQLNSAKVLLEYIITTINHCALATAAALYDTALLTDNCQHHNNILTVKTPNTAPGKHASTVH